MTLPPVVLLHGLARSHRSMSGLRRHLERHGFPTWSESYPSRRQPLGALADDLAARIGASLPMENGLLAVTHSMGGVLLRHLSTRLPWRGAVLLAPPNRGSRLALAFRDHPLFRWFYGPAGQELVPPGTWPSPPSPFAVIAGTRSLGVNPAGWLVRALGVLPRALPSDGTVAVDETILDGMAAFHTVPASHTFIMDHPLTRQLVVKFLVDGTF